MSVKNEILDTIKKQTEFWAHGELEKIINSYENATNTLFINAKSIVKGYQAIREMYRRMFPESDLSKMGKMSFPETEIRPLAFDYVLVVGKWNLKNSTGNDIANGHFSTIYHKTSMGWKICIDHRSSPQNI